MLGDAIRGNAQLRAILAGALSDTRARLSSRNDSDSDDDDAPPARHADAAHVIVNGEKSSLDLFCCCTRAHPLRRAALLVADSFWLEAAAIAMTIANFVSLALYRALPDESPFSGNKYLEFSEKNMSGLFFGFFSLEVIIKITALGPYAYAANPSNSLDALTTFLSLAALISSLANFTALRALRLAKILNFMLARVPVMNEVFLQSVARIMPVAALLFATLSVFAFIGVSTARGLLQGHCAFTDPATLAASLAVQANMSADVLLDWVNASAAPRTKLIITGTQCALPCDARTSAVSCVRAFGDTCSQTFVPGFSAFNSSRTLSVAQACVAGANPQYGEQSFDDFGRALMSVFQSMTTEGWFELSSRLRSTYGSDAAVIIFFLALIGLCSYWILSISAAIVVGSFKKFHNRHERNSVIDALVQRKLLSKREAKFSIGHADDIPEVREARSSAYDALCKYVFAAFPAPPGCLVHGLRLIVDNPLYSALTAVAVIANSIMLAFGDVNISDVAAADIEYANFAFTSLFLIDILLRLGATGASIFFASPFNALDAGVIFVSVLDIILQISSDAGHSSSVSVLRTFRILRVLTLTKRWPAFATLLASIGDLFSDFIAASSVLAFLVVTFAVFGLSFIGPYYDDALRSGVIKELPAGNFADFGSAIVTTFWVLTGEHWEDVVYPHMAICGGAAGVFFVALLFFGNYIFLNIILAIVLRGLETAERRTADAAALADESAFTDSRRGSQSSVESFFINARVRIVALLHAAGAECRDRCPGNCRVCGHCGADVDDFGAVKTHDFSSARRAQRIFARSLQNGASQLILTTLRADASKSVSNPLGATAAGDSTAVAIVSRREEGELSFAFTSELGLRATAEALRAGYASLRDALVAFEKWTLFSKASYTATNENAASQVGASKRGATAAPLSAAAAATRVDIITLSEADFCRPAGAIVTVPANTFTIAGIVARPALRIRVFENATRVAPMARTEDQSIISRRQHLRALHIGLSNYTRDRRQWWDGPDAARSRDAGHVGDSLFATRANPLAPLKKSHIELEATLAGVTREAIETSTDTKYSLATSSSRHYSCGFISKDDPVRRWLNSVLAHPVTEGLLIALILWSSINLALDEPRIADCGTLPLSDPRSCRVLSRYLDISDITITTIFTIEMAAKMLVQGVIFAPTAYLRDPWCVLDGLCVLVSLLSFILDNAGLSGSPLKSLRALRTLRALRPLRVISRFESLRLVAGAIAATIPTFLRLIPIVVLIMFIVAVIGMQTFKGVLASCNDTDPAFASSAMCTGTFLLRGNSCALLPLETDEAACRASSQGVPFARVWSSTPYNWDTFSDAMWIVGSSISTGEGWPLRMHELMRATGGGPAAPIFFIACILLLPWFIIKFLTAAVVDAYVRTQVHGHGQALLVPAQQRWISALREVLRLRPRHRVAAAEGGSSACGGRAALIVVRDGACFFILRAPTLLAQFIVLAVMSARRTRAEVHSLNVCTHVFTAVFVVDVAVIVWGLGARAAFATGWFPFHATCVFLRVLYIALEQASFNADARGASRESALALAAWIVSLAVPVHLLCALEMMSSLRVTVSRLFRTFYTFINVVALLGLCCYFFAVIGMNTFSGVRAGGATTGALDDVTNFNSFGSSLWTLIRCLTGEQFNDIALDLGVAPPYCNPDSSCGQGDVAKGVLGIFEFFSNTVLVKMLFAAVFVIFATVRDGDDTNDAAGLLTTDTADAFLNAWSHADPNATGLIAKGDLSRVLQHVPALTQRRRRDKRSTLQESAEALAQSLPVAADEAGRIQFHAAFIALLTTVAGGDAGGAHLAAVTFLGGALPSEGATRKEVAAAATIQNAWQAKRMVQ